MIPTRPLGKTALQVSEISLGTVQLGMPYGLPDSTGKIPHLTEAQSLEILRRAFTEGVNFLDTGRSYGDSEALIGKALKKCSQDILIATKAEPLSEQMDDEELAKALKSSIETSRRTMDRETLDLYQIHNATPALLKREVIMDVLSYARHREWIRYQGVTTYGTQAPEFAIEQGYWDTIQMEFNCFNQETGALFDAAQERQVGVIIRSAMLKGAMTVPEQEVPDALKTLRQRAQELPAFFDRRDLTIPQIALLYVLSHPQVATVLTGVVNTSQLLENLNVKNEPIFTAEQLAEARHFHVNDPQLTDPRQWAFETRGR
jgi:aryl-alcohol dehydrogenase-like predicted oxidoreductase